MLSRNIERLKTDRKKQAQKPANIKRTYEILAKKLRSQPQAQPSNSEPSNSYGGQPKNTSGNGNSNNKLRGSHNNNGEENSYLSRYKHQQQIIGNNNSHQPTTNDRTAPATNNSHNNNNKSNNGGKKKARFREDQDRDSETSSSLDQQHLLAEQNMILNSSTAFYNNYSPLSTPANYRNNTPARMADPYGVNPLPNIRSPYFSARDSFYPPNLESWGINNTAALYDDTYYLSRHSPFLPVYSTVTKNNSQKVIIYAFKIRFHQTYVEF